MKNKENRKRSSTVPNTPKHHNNSISNNNTCTINTNDDTIITTTTTSNRNGFYWEAFLAPAHFMLPTFAINCRNFKHVEKCPRASKGKSNQRKTINATVFLIICFYFHLLTLVKYVN